MMTPNARGRGRGLVLVMNPQHRRAVADGVNEMPPKAPAPESKTIRITAAEKAKLDRLQSEPDRLQCELDRVQSELDRLQSEWDRLLTKVIEADRECRDYLGLLGKRGHVQVCSFREIRPDGDEFLLDVNDDELPS